MTYFKAQYHHNDTKIIMDLPRVKYSRGKVVPHSDLLVGTTLGDSKQRANCYNFKVPQ
jgi:hypothetical protein